MLLELILADALSARNYVLMKRIAMEGYNLVWNRLPIGPELIHSIFPFALPITAR